MRILLTGASGQLGREVLLSAPPDPDLTACDRSQLDLTQHDRVREIVVSQKPDFVVNAAAYTAVDRAESESELAWAVNCEGVANLAQAAKEVGARLIHLSTDFVFDGNSSRPYLPGAATAPQSVYGRSKLGGENAIEQILGDRGLVLRTSWVYSRFGNNFVKTMLRLLSERDEVGVVSDQVGSPTWARGLAATIWKIVEAHDLAGVHHWADAGVASWFDFAVAIQEEAEQIGLLKPACRIRPLRTQQYPTPARRPHFSVLDSMILNEILGIASCHWRRQLRAMLHDLQEHSTRV